MILMHAGTSEQDVEVLLENGFDNFEGFRDLLERSELLDQIGVEDKQTVLQALDRILNGGPEVAEEQENQNTILEEDVEESRVFPPVTQEDEPLQYLKGIEIT